MRPGGPGAPRRSGHGLPAKPRAGRNSARRQKIGGGADESILCFQYLKMPLKVGAKLPIESA
jgi:hypothetical protein